MINKIDARSQYFLACAQDLCGKNLSGIARTDSYLRQPDYSSRAVGHYYLILREAVGLKTASRVRYLQAEFPELVLNYLTEKELAGYPGHGVWQFHTCPWLYRNECVDLVLRGRESDLPEAVRQAIFGSAHAARLYYLRNLPTKMHTWGVRQLGWAMRNAENGVCKLLGLLEKGEYQIRPVAGLNEEDVAWLTHANENWQPIERRLLQSVDEFRLTAARLSGIVECYSEHMAFCYPDTQPLVAKEADVPPEAIRAMTEPIVKALRDTIGNRMLSFYLHGSAARGDMRSDSDIDTMAVFDHVDAEILERTRLIQCSFNKLTISVYSVDNIKQYPKFRRYGLINGTRHIAGPLCFAREKISTESAYGILNNAYTIRQVARGYLVAGCYGHRAHYMLSLMVKLADHGCLRPLQQLESKKYPEDRAAAAAYFSGREQAHALLHHASKLTEKERSLQAQLLEGKRDDIEQHWLELDNFATEVEEKARPYLL